MKENEAFDYLMTFEPKPNDGVRRNLRRYLKTIDWLPLGKQVMLDLGSERFFILLLTKLRPEYEVYTQGLDNTRGAKADSSRVDRIDTHLEQFKGHSAFDVEKDKYPYENNFFDIVLSMELIEHLTHDPMHMIVEINRILKVGGHLVLTTPNLMSWRSVFNLIMGRSPMEFMFYFKGQGITQHVREFLPWELKMSIEQAGFHVTRLKTYSFTKSRSIDFVELMFSVFLRLYIILRLRHPKFLVNRGSKTFIMGKKVGAPAENPGAFLYWKDGYSENLWR